MADTAEVRRAGESCFLFVIYFALDKQYVPKALKKDNFLCLWNEWRAQTTPFFHVVNHFSKMVWFCFLTKRQAELWIANAFMIIRNMYIFFLWDNRMLSLQARGPHMEKSFSSLYANVVIKLSVTLQSSLVFTSLQWTSCLISAFSSGLMGNGSQTTVIFQDYCVIPFLSLCPLAFHFPLISHQSIVPSLTTNCSECCGQS